MDTNNNYNSNNYNSYYQQPGSDQNKAPKKGNGIFKKLIIGALVGLMFGIFGGLGFWAVNYSTNLLVGNGIVKEKEKESDSENESTKSVPSGDKAEEATEDKSIEAPDIKEANAIPKGEYYVNDVTSVVENTMPSVVAVTSSYVSKMNYFGKTYSQESKAAGSGIIVGKNDEELLLVTNQHVVDDAEELTVTFADNENVSAQIKGTDADRDLAVIAVQLSDIKPSTMNSIVIAKLGDSDALTVGEPVVAIGNALGYGQSVTVGVVSALDRAIAATTSSTGEEINKDATFVQTDAAINPGNSGGALINMKGEVIGINSNKIGGSLVEGVGYAIPISDAKPIIEELMTKKTKVKVDEDDRGKLGITGVNVEKQYSEIYGMPVGVYISSVTEGTGAEFAGLVRGDIIVGIEGEEVSSMDDLIRELEYYKAGDTVEITIMQGSPTGYQSKTVVVTLSPADKN